MEPERPDGDGGGQQGLKARGTGLMEKARGSAVALKERAEAEAKTYKDPQQTQLWKSIFRVSHDRSDPRNRSLAILSNGDRDMLQASGPYIGFQFDHVISVQEAGYFKPHRKTYAKATEIIGLDRSNILFVANHAFDCIGAKSYGMRTAFIDRRKRPFGQTPHQPDLIVADFAELAATLA